MQELEVYILFCGVSYGFFLNCTKERKGLFFTAVPHQWEVNNILFCHLIRKELEKERSNGASVSQQNWAQFECTVKCSNIPDFERALSIEKNFTKRMDTDVEDEYKGNKQSLENRNAQMLLAMEKNNFSVLNKSSEKTVENDVSVINNVEILPTVYTMEVNDAQEIKAEILDLKTNLSELKKSIIEHHIETNVALDKILLLLQVNKCYHNEGISKEKNEPNFLEKFHFPLQTTQQIEDLNTSLQVNSVLRKQIITFLQNVGGTSGTMDGVKIAYKIVDILFVPDCFLEYSWTGISRGKEIRKKPFQKYEEIVDMIFNVLVATDNRFTKEKTISIFRDKILKHAKSRSLRKMQITKKNEVINKIETVEDDENQEIECQEKDSQEEVHDNENV